MDVVPSGVRDQPTAGRIEGVRSARLEPHVDHRGSLFELVNFDHPFWQEPVVHAYGITIRPGRIKGWGMHNSRPTATQSSTARCASSSSTAAASR